MARVGDGIRRYEAKGKTKYLARVRVVDDKGIARNLSQAFDDIKSAKIWRASKTQIAKLGNIGKEIEKNQLLSKVRLSQLVQAYQAKLSSDKEDASRNGVGHLGSREHAMLGRFLRDPICNKFIGEVDHTTLDDYVDRRKTLVALSTIDRELNPVRKMCDLARKGKLPGELRGQCIPFDPFENFEIGEYESHRDRWLKSLDEDRQIFDAIDKQCRTILLKRRWLTFVVLALSTGLRRRVTLQLKWEDVHIKDRLISIKPEYYSRNKLAPPYVPISKNLYQHIMAYFNMLPEVMRKPNDRLFPYNESSFNNYWDRIIQHTNLYETKMKNGEEISSYINIHALRHTCETRYDDKPYNLTPKEYGYLLGHRRLDEDNKLSRTQQKYNHWDDKRHRAMCDDIRKAIDLGDTALDKQYRAQGTFTPDLAASLDIGIGAFQAHAIKMVGKKRKGPPPTKADIDGAQEFMNNVKIALEKMESGEFDQEFDKLNEEEKTRLLENMKEFTDWFIRTQVQKPTAERQPTKTGIRKVKLTPRNPHYNKTVDLDEKLIIGPPSQRK